MKERTIQINAGDVEHLGVMALGCALTLFGISKRKSAAGLAMGMAGAALIARGAQGYKRLYRVVGKELPGRPVTPAKRSPVIEESILIERPPEDLYRFWRKLDNLPQVMDHLVAVREVTETRSQWIAKAPAGTVVEWAAEIIEDIPNELISWQSLEGSDVDCSGSVSFESDGAGGTILSLMICYNPPADLLGVQIAKLTGADPRMEVAEDLVHFKTRMELDRVAADE
jgi:uncharacterized membrane protein